MEVTLARNKLKKYKVIKRQRKKEKLFSAASVPFVKKYKKEISVAASLVRHNLTKLRSGVPVEEKGFIIKPAYNGRTYSGINAALTLSVSFKGKTFFVKMGGHCGENVFEGYAKAREYFKSKGNFMHGYKVEVVPTYIFYLKKNNRAEYPNGVIVSDFFPKERFDLLRDVELFTGQKFLATPLGKATSRIKKDLEKEINVYDANTFNCFVDKKTNTLYFFDLFAPGRY